MIGLLTTPQSSGLGADKDSMFSQQILYPLHINS